MIREDVRDVSSVRRQTPTQARTGVGEPDSTQSVREEPEAPRAELPEWLAKELFRIFC